MNFSEVNILWVGLNWLSDWPYCRFHFCSTKSICYSIKDLHTTVNKTFMTFSWQCGIQFSTIQNTEMNSQ